MRSTGSAVGDCGSAPPAGTCRPSTWIVIRPTSLIERRRTAVADRRVDLAGDLGDRDAEGDRDVELDLDAVVDAHGQAGRAEAEAFDQATDRSAGESGDAVRTEGRRPDDVAKGAARDE